MLAIFIYFESIKKVLFSKDNPMDSPRHKQLTGVQD